MTAARVAKGSMLGLGRVCGFTIAPIASRQASRLDWFSVRQLPTATLPFRPSYHAYSTSSASAPESVAPQPEMREGMDDGEQHIWNKLRDALEPSKLLVRDVSGGCGTMYAIDITAEKFRRLPMVRQHRLVNEVLKEEISGWHGCQLRTRVE
jgi:stress-induced morphogen